MLSSHWVKKEDHEEANLIWLERDREKIKNQQTSQETGEGDQVVFEKYDHGKEDERWERRKDKEEKASVLRRKEYFYKGGKFSEESKGKK